jgi:amidase
VVGQALRRMPATGKTVRRSARTDHAARDCVTVVSCRDVLDPRARLVGKVHLASGSLRLASTLPNRGDQRTVKSGTVIMRAGGVMHHTITRRAVVRLAAGVVSAAGGGSVPVTGASRAIAGVPWAATRTQITPFSEVEGATLLELRTALDTHQLSVRELVEQYLRRIAAIDGAGPLLRSVLELNPEATAIAEDLDQELQADRRRGPLHGIPILLKDTIDTADQMLTTAGSLALVNSRPRQDAAVVRRLRDAGVVILGKTNLSEWANFRSTHASSGWSARGGQTRNPYVLDASPCGSSSGSAAAVAAGLAAVAVGTETDGSIVCPASVTSVVGIKPTVGLVSRGGVIPIAHSQDSVGPLGRTVADAAMLLGVMVGLDPRDPATAVSPAASRSGQGVPGSGAPDYTQFFDADGLRGARIGIPRKVYWGNSPESDALAEAAIAVLQQQGAEVIDPADIPTAEAMREEPGEFEVLLYEFKADLNAYLAERRDPAIRSLAELIRFNKEHASEEMPSFGQEIFALAQEKGALTSQGYRDALARNQRLAREEGIDAVMDAYHLDALVTPSAEPPWPIDLVNGDPVPPPSSSTPAALAGYPIISVPAGYTNERPVGISFLGRAWSEPTLIRLAYAFEQATRMRQRPRFLSS